MGGVCSRPGRQVPATGVPVPVHAITAAMPVIIVTNSRDERTICVTFYPRSIEVVSDGVVGIDIARSSAAATAAVIDLVSHWYAPVLNKDGAISIRTNFMRSLANASPGITDAVYEQTTIDAGQMAPLYSALVATTKAVNVGIAIRNLARV